MSGGRDRLDRLVLEAAALDASRRGELLAAHAVTDPGLAAEARRRLEAAGALGEDFLAPPATRLLDGAAGGPAAPAPPAGDERWEIGELLGSGGMASVYRAYDRRLDRPVALKLLDADDPDTPRRLLAEARAQARVRHPAVLDVYETGELDGRPYIASRYVAGGTLADLGAEVSLEQRVRLLAEIAEGLHAAHREGLLHGDVKPSNVLVEETPDGEPTAWIGDFGIATEMATDPAAGGGASRLAGTPRYMAPELLRRPGAGGDRRSDVFSLGVTLHEALTGEPPQRGDGWRELRRRHPGLPPDLAAVVARCLDEEPEGRYPSARAVAEDLRRFLDGEVVTAYADRRAYRLSRFVGRHRALVAVTCVSAILLVAALAVAAVAGLRAVRANALAEQRRAQAEELVDFMLVDLRDKLEPVGRLDLLDDVGEQAMDYFATVPESELSDEELARRSMALYQLGDVRMRQGDLAGAERPFAESLALAQLLAERSPDDPERLFGLGQSEFWAGYVRWEAGDLDAARGHFEAYHAVSERLVGMAPENRDYRLELSYAESNLGSLAQARGDLDAALDRFLAALAIDRELVAGAASEEEADGRRFELAATHNTVGQVLERLGRLDEAEVHYAADVELRRAMLARQPENRRWREFLAVARQYRGLLALERGRLGAARDDLDAAAALLDELVAYDAGNDSWRYKLAWNRLHRGRLARAEGDAAAARAAWEGAAALASELAAADPQRLDRQQLDAVARHHLALATADASGAAAAREASRRAVERLRELHQRRPDDRRGRRWLAEGLLLLGDAEAAAGKPAAAGEAWRRAADVLAPLMAEARHDHEVLLPWSALLARLGRGGEAAEAAARLERVLAGSAA